MQCSFILNLGDRKIMQKEFEIFAKDGMSNIFDGALLPNLNNKTNQVSNYRAIGYRLENKESKNVQVYSRSEADSRGVYAANLFLNNVRRRSRRNRSTFFPKDWKREQVTDAIFEAYQSKTQINIANNQYVGQTSDGMIINLWLDESDRIIDAMPLHDGVRQGRKKKAKRCCKRCGQPKQTICLKHHSYKKKGIEKVLAIIKRYSRKFYFSLARRLKFVE